MQSGNDSAPTSFTAYGVLLMRWSAFAVNLKRAVEKYASVQALDPWTITSSAVLAGLALLKSSCFTCLKCLMRLFYMLCLLLLE